MAKYEIKTLSPLHIGTGETITQYNSYVNDGHLVVANLSSLLSRSPARASQFAFAVERNPRGFNLGEFLTPEEKSQVDKRLYRARLSRCAENYLRHGTREVREAIKHATSQSPMIPGSSIKGALRTAILYYLLKNNRDILQQLLTDIQGNTRDKELTLPLLRGSRNDPKFDYLRTLEVGDTLPAPAAFAVHCQGVLSANVMLESRHDVRRRPVRAEFKRFVALLECIPPETSLSGRVRLNATVMEPEYAKLFGWKKHHVPLNCRLLCSAANAFAEIIVARELDYFRRFDQAYPAVERFYSKLAAQLKKADQSTCYVCLGWGSGWHKTTIGLLLQQSLGPRFASIRRRYRLASNRLHFQFPKTRKLIMESRDVPSVPLGWVRLRFTDEER